MKRDGVMMMIGATWNLFVDMESVEWGWRSEWRCWFQR